MQWFQGIADYVSQKIIRYPPAGPHLPAFRRPALCSRRARTNRHCPRWQPPHNWQGRLPGSRRHVPASTRHINAHDIRVHVESEYDGEMHEDEYDYVVVARSLDAIWNINHQCQADQEAS